MKGKEKDCIPKRPCPYEGCGCKEVWFWGWYERKEGCLPVGDGDEVAEAVPLRRFWCTACERTFSWRPWFLLYGRRYAALFYQLAFKDWGHARRVPAPNVWYDLNAAGRRAFFRFLERRGTELSDRLDDRRQPPVAEPQMARPETTWQLARRYIRILFDLKQPPLSIHLVCVALARHRYRLESL